MGSRSRLGRIAGVATAAAVTVALTAPAANADFHLMVIREVGTEPDFVELQMYAPGQNLVAGHTITTYESGGNPIGTPFTFPSNAPNGENQRTILVGHAGTNPDFTAAFNVVSNEGGAVCFDAIDCVTFGNYGGGPFSTPTGTPALFPGGIPVGASIDRTIARGCATLLEPLDDTNDSAADFFLATPSPRSNAAPPTETPCTGETFNPGGGPDTNIDNGPKKKTKKKSATFQFSSPTPGVTFECELDGGKAFTPCTSPFTVKVKKGKHSFKVRAVLDGVPDGSPAEYSWKVKKKKKKK